MESLTGKAEEMFVVFGESILAQAGVHGFVESIELVADDGVTKSFKRCTDLMGASCLGDDG